MYQIDNPTASATQPAPTAPGTPGYFTDGSPVGGVPATIVPAEWLNAIQHEMINVLDAAGISPSKSTYDQLATAISTSIKNAGFHFSFTNIYSDGPLTLAASQAGSFIDLSSSYTGDITLPPLSTVPDGSTFYIWSGSASSFNVKRAGSDRIFINNDSSVTSITMGPGDTLVIGKSGPAEAWVAMWGSAQFLSSAVGQSLAPKPINTVGAVGKFGILTTASGAALTLPAGGTWAYFAVAYNSTGQAVTSPLPVSAVGAGGAVIGAATAGIFWYGFAWRIQ